MTLAAAAGLGLGFALDRLLGDPRRGHPVAGFGLVADWLEERWYRDDRRVGAVYTAVLVGGAAGLGVLLGRWGSLAVTVVTGIATWTVLGGRSLEREALAIGALLEQGDLDGARRQLPNLVGRDPAELDAGGIARAVVESVAENTSDAVVAPLLWGAIGGLPCLLGYRAANTLDAMVGHRSERFRHFGWAAARLDDALNWTPARLSAVCAALLGDDPAGAWRAVRRDAGRHPSPNAGVVEAAFAGALGIRLGGVNLYDGVAEDRGTLGDGRAVEVADIARAVGLARRVGLVAALLAVAAAAGAAGAVERLASRVR